MQFRKIDNVPLRAENVSKTGALYYLRWDDEYSNIYVQIIDVVGGKGAGNGTFSQNLFPIDNIGNKIDQTGYDLASGQPKITKDRNMFAFLRAVKEDIARRANEA